MACPVPDTPTWRASLCAGSLVDALLGEHWQAALVRKVRGPNDEELLVLFSPTSHTKKDANGELILEQEWFLRSSGKLMPQGKMFEWRPEWMEFLLELAQYPPTLEMEVEGKPSLAPPTGAAATPQWRGSLKIGDVVDCEDKEGTWCTGTIVAFGSKADVQIHFHQWDSQWDEFVPIASSRLQPVGSRCSFIPNTTPAWRLNMDVNTLVDCLDTENQWLAGVVIGVRTDEVQIHYDDFDAEWDEWIKRTSPRLAQRGTKVPVIIG